MNHVYINHEYKKTFSNDGVVYVSQHFNNETKNEKEKLSSEKSLRRRTNNC